ncbi:hypothetical protein R1sor_011523 [Riccia sorocarpa]|uniref:PGG domain-containing protein n=1 Tax=Riccia sorocarpa TaxID=122646 RepID=A0ABD3I3V3_9MARC
MAEIQCHHAINSALSKFLRNVQNLLGDDHPYKLYTKPLETRWNEDWQELQILEPDYEESDHEDLQVPPESKETLRIYVQRHCSGLEKWIGRHDAPNNTFRGGTMSDSEKESRSEFHTYPLWVRRWMVTAPFLPLSEYIFLECMRRWRFKPEFGYNPYTLDATIMQAFIDAWRGCESEMESRTDVSFFQYIMRITDTRRTAFHYGLIGGLRWNIENDVRDLGSPFLMLYSKVSDNGDYGKWAHQYDPYRQNSALEENILREFEVLFNMRDGSGRTLLHILLTSDLEIPPLESRCWGLERNLYIWGRLYPRFDWSVPWLYKWDNWSFKNEVWRRNVQCVYEGYGFQGLESWIPWWRSGKCLPLSADMIVMTSAHLSDSERSARLLWLLDRRLLPQFSPTSVVARFQGVTGAVTECVMLSSLQYAVLLGDTASAEVLAKDNRIYDPARIHIESKESPDHTFARIEHETHLSELDPAFFYSESSLHVAAKHADPEMLRIILDTGKFNPHYDEGNTILHSAVRCHLESPPVPQVMLQDFVEIPKIHTHLLSNLSVAADGKDGTTEDADKRPCQCTKRMEQQREKALDMESGRQGCVNYLLQVGLDVWETDQYNRIADPGPQASRGYKTWWYDKLAQETQDQKANFGAAANALSVTAALVATASYVGPLQPPLGLNFVDNDQNLKVLVDILPVRIFIVCNNLAFFFALVAIVLSLTPSLPMPKEPMLEELKRMRRSITLALIALIMSINTILMAFASAIIAVIPNKGSWNHGWLSMGTLVVGGPICLFVLLLCCIRAVRLLFHNNFVVRRFYKRTVFI